MMEQEFELKLSLSQGAILKLHQVLIGKGGVRRSRLQAFYVDTENFLLAKKGIALRIRKEGRYWVQTLKTPGRNDFERNEHNVKLATWNPKNPHIDLTLHEGHEAGRQLNRLLNKHPKLGLKIQFNTDIWRRTALFKSRNGVVEYALDEGVIQANHNDRQTEVQVSEVEIELKEGSYDAVIAHARQLINRYGAYLDSRTKAQRGNLAARGLSCGEPIRGDVEPFGNQTNSQIVSGLIGSCLRQIVGNTSEINAGLSNYDEHLHQLRVGLRRLKTALKVLDLIEIRLSPSESEVLAAIFLKLGIYRDSNYLTEKLNPDLLAVNGPVVSVPKVDTQVHPSVFLKSKQYHLLLIKLLEWQLQQQAQQQPQQQTQQDIQSETQSNANELTVGHVSSENANLKKLTLEMMNKIHKSAKKKASVFSKLPEMERHELRKKLKRFRYTIEFFYEFMQRKSYKEFAKQLRVVLEHLGDYNDICMAIESINESLDQNVPHWFALGWLKAEQKRVEHLSDQSLQQFFTLKKIW